jgi:hypothetical protein
MATSLFEEVFGELLRTHVRKRPKGPELRKQVSELTRAYVARLNDLERPSGERVRTELCSIFEYMRDEALAYGRGKPHIQTNIAKIVNALNAGINAKRKEHLLDTWRNWEAMVNPTSPAYVGINLPASMIIEGYLVFEDLIPIRKYFGGN